MREDKQILLVTQKNAAQDEPATTDLFQVGTIGTVLQLLKLPDGTVKVLVEGGQRQKSFSSAIMTRSFRPMPSCCPKKRRPIRIGSSGAHRDFAVRAVHQAEQKIPPEVLVSINQIDDPSKLADTIASHLALKIPEKQELLETDSVSERLEKVFGFMESEIGVLQVEKRIRNRVKRQMEKTSASII